MSSVAKFASFWDHVSDLRQTLLKTLCIIILGVSVSFYFHEVIISGLTSPLREALTKTENQPAKIESYYIANNSLSEQKIELPKEVLMLLSSSSGVEFFGENSYKIPPGGSLAYAVAMSKGPSLVVLGPLEGLTITLKTCLWVGIVVTSPLWLWAILQFVIPALTRQEKHLIFPFLALSFLLIGIGASFTFFLTIPLANRYLLAFNQDIAMNLWSLSHYLNYTLFLLLANGFAFELLAVGLFAVHLGAIEAEWLMSKRRGAFLLAFVLAALLTPPDVLTQWMLAIPLIVFYEGIILYAKFR